MHSVTGYRIWIALLIGIIAVAAALYARQLDEGLVTTGLGLDVPWGLYIAQLTFLVGVAASAVMVVIPYHLHRERAFAGLAILGEFVAISACIMSVLFVLVDMGRPDRALNIILFPSPKSMMLWDALVIFGYLLLNVVLARSSLIAERNGVDPPRWHRPLILVSIPWAVAVHTVTAFLYSGLSARVFWFTAVLAPRFLASAFASGPACLILVAWCLRAFGGYDVGREAVIKVGRIVAYCAVVNVYLWVVELFTGLYEGSEHHAVPFRFVYFGGGESASLGPWMWASAGMTLVALGLLMAPRTRLSVRAIRWACGLVVAAIWTDKGLGLIVAGFVPNAFGGIPSYKPTASEIAICLGVYAFGGLLLTLFCRGLIKTRVEMRCARLEETT